MRISCRVRGVSAIAAALGLAVIMSGCVDTKSVVITMPTVASAQDGSYEGEYKLGPVTAQVRVVLEAGRIKSFEIVRHDCFKGRPAEALASRVVEMQTVELDAVSGATVSSKAILKAGEIALRSAGQ